MTPLRDMQSTPIFFLGGQLDVTSILTSAETLSELQTCLGQMRILEQPASSKEEEEAKASTVCRIGLRLISTDTTKYKEALSCVFTRSSFLPFLNNKTVEREK